MVVDQLKKYVNFQLRLIDAFQCTFGQVKDKFLMNIPKEGEVESEGILWHFRKHGCGVIFIDHKTKIKIDIHELFVDPSFFDKWRLRTYFGSLGKRGVKLMSSITGTASNSLDKNIEEWLEMLLENGEIEKIDDYYRLI